VIAAAPALPGIEPLPTGCIGGATTFALCPALTGTGVGTGTA
jgi:hypothetical protein